MGSKSICVTVGGVLILYLSIYFPVLVRFYFCLPRCCCLTLFNFNLKNSLKYVLSVSLVVINWFFWLSGKVFMSHLVLSAILFFICSFVFPFSFSTLNVLSCHMLACRFSSEKYTDSLLCSLIYDELLLFYCFENSPWLDSSIIMCLDVELFRSSTYLEFLTSQCGYS